jgi:hypothetical protein
MNMKLVLVRRKSKDRGMHGFIHSASRISGWYNPNFTRDLEGETQELSDRLPNTEFVIVGDMNSRIGRTQTCHTYMGLL